MPNDFLIDTSCHHDSSFLLVFNSGLVLWFRPKLRGEPVRKEHFLDCKPLWELDEDEKPLRGLGSQTRCFGILTTKGRLHACNVAGAAEVLIGKGTRYKGHFWVIENPCEGKVIERVFFGHRMWFGIAGGLLYEIALHEMRECETGVFAWRRVPGTENLTTAVVSGDCGSAHQAFVTADRQVYTWGVGNFGMLGHGGQEGNESQPRKVAFFADKKVVAVAAGGFYDFPWYGSFTLFLLDNNELYFAGRLGSETENHLPVLVPTPPNSHILSISAGEDWAAIVCSGSVDKLKIV